MCFFHDKNKSNTKMTATVPKQDQNTWEYKKTTILIQQHKTSNTWPDTNQPHACILQQTSAVTKSTLISLTLLFVSAFIIYIYIHVCL